MSETSDVTVTIPGQPTSVWVEDSFTYLVFGTTRVKVEGILTSIVPGESTTVTLRRQPAKSSDSSDDHNDSGLGAVVPEMEVIHPPSAPRSTSGSRKFHHRFTVPKHPNEDVGGRSESSSSHVLEIDVPLNWKSEDSATESSPAEDQQRAFGHRPQKNFPMQDCINSKATWGPVGGGDSSHSSSGKLQDQDSQDITCSNRQHSVLETDFSCDLNDNINTAVEDTENQQRAPSQIPSDAEVEMGSSIQTGTYRRGCCQPVNLPAMRRVEMSWNLPEEVHHSRVVSPPARELMTNAREEAGHSRSLSPAAREFEATVHEESHHSPELIPGVRASNLSAQEFETNGSEEESFPLDVLHGVSTMSSNAGWEPKAVPSLNFGFRGRPKTLLSRDFREFNARSRPSSAGSSRPTRPSSAGSSRPPVARPSSAGSSRPPGARPSSAGSSRPAHSTSAATSQPSVCSTRSLLSRIGRGRQPQQQVPRSPLTTNSRKAKPSQPEPEDVDEFNQQIPDPEHHLLSMKRQQLRLLRMIQKTQDQLPLKRANEQEEEERKQAEHQCQDIPEAGLDVENMQKDSPADVPPFQNPYQRRPQWSVSQPQAWRAKYLQASLSPEMEGKTGSGSQKDSSDRIRDFLERQSQWQEDHEARLNERREEERQIERNQAMRNQAQAEEELDDTKKERQIEEFIERQMLLDETKKEKYFAKMQQAMKQVDQMALSTVRKVEGGDENKDAAVKNFLARQHAVQELKQAHLEHIDRKYCPLPNGWEGEGRLYPDEAEELISSFLERHDDELWERDKRRIEKMIVGESQKDKKPKMTRQAAAKTVQGFIRRQKSLGKHGTNELSIRSSMIAMEMVKSIQRSPKVVAAGMKKIRAVQAKKPEIPDLAESDGPSSSAEPETAYKAKSKWRPTANKVVPASQRVAREMQITSADLTSQDSMSDEESDVLGKNSASRRWSAVSSDLRGVTAREKSSRGSILGTSILAYASHKRWPNFMRIIPHARDDTINVKDQDGNTVLHLAALDGQEEACWQLLTHTDFVCAFDKNNAGFTALHYAACSGLVNVCHFMLNQPGFALDAKEHWFSRTPFDFALRMQKIVVEQVMVKYGVLLAAAHAKRWNECLDILRESDMNMVDAQDGRGNTTLHLAALSGQRGVCMAILNRARVDSTNTRNGCGHTALHYAAGGGDNMVVTSITDRPEFTEINALANVDNWTALDFAIRYSRKDVAKIIRRSGGFRSKDLQ